MASQPSCDAEKKRLASAQAKVSEQYQEIDLLKKQLAAMQTGAAIHFGQRGSVGELKQFNEKNSPRSTPHSAADGVDARLHMKKVGANSVPSTHVHAKKTHADEDTPQVVHKKNPAEPSAASTALHSKGNPNLPTAMQDKRPPLTPRNRWLRSLSEATSRGLHSYQVGTGPSARSSAATMT